MRKSIVLILFAAAWSNAGRAQGVSPSTINSAGGGAPIGSYEFDWSVGEMTMVSTFSQPSVVVTQGLLQPYDGPTKVVKTTIPATQLQVFPNPATSVVNVQYTAQDQGTLAYRLLDMNGKIIKTHVTDTRQGTTTEQINVSTLAAATYMLEVIVNGSATSTFKIQKLQ
jgi:Secretion system C-terminal sorting domain